MTEFVKSNLCAKRYQITHPVHWNYRQSGAVTRILILSAHSNQTKTKCRNRKRKRERVWNSCNVQISNIKSNQVKHKIYKKIVLIMIFRSKFACSICIYLRLQTRAKMENPHIFFRLLCLHIMYALNVAL